MYEINQDYHLPNGAYWACCANYNGLSRIENMRDTSLMHNMRVGELKNKKIPTNISKQLA